MKKIALFLSLMIACGSLFGAVANGSAAPAFTLKDVAGKEVSLADFAGKYVVLEWVNPGCPFVKKFYDVGAMQRMQREAAAKDVVWLSINSTTPSHGDYMSPEQTAKYIAEKQVASTWLMDPEGTVGKAYDARRTPHMYVINPEGILIYQGAIDDNPSANPDDIAGALNYVTTALEQAMAGKPVSTDNTRPYGCSIKY